MRCRLRAVLIVPIAFAFSLLVQEKTYLRARLPTKTQPAVGVIQHTRATAEKVLRFFYQERFHEYGSMGRYF